MIRADWGLAPLVGRYGRGIGNKGACGVRADCPAKGGQPSDGVAVPFSPPADEDEGGAMRATTGPDAAEAAKEMSCTHPAGDDGGRCEGAGAGVWDPAGGGQNGRHRRHGEGSTAGTAHQRGSVRTKRKPGNDLLSRPIGANIIGAEGLTAVFGMGTGVSLPL